MKKINDKKRSFTVPLELIEKKELSKDSSITYIKEGKAVVDKKIDKEYFQAKTTSDNTVYYQTYERRPSFYKVEGYVKKNDISAVAFCSLNKAFIIFIFTMFFIIGALLVYNNQKVSINNDTLLANEKQTKANETTTEKGSGISNLDDFLKPNASVKSLSVPQFSELYITKGTYVPLMNLPQNEVLLIYEVYTLDNKLVFASEDPLLPNSEDEWYLSDYSKGDYDFIVKAIKVDENGNRGNSITFNTTIHIN